MADNVYLALGSNINDREKNLKDAVNMILRLPATGLKAVSNIYETEPVGYLEQDSFLNAVILIETALSPVQLLDEIQKIEKDLKRTREIRWGPRTIDIDILLYDNLDICLPQLEIPHPRMFERAFVLVPLKDVIPGGRVRGMLIDELLENCNDRDGVRLYKNDWWE
ncbi:MAG TPA: 2-amino-4-hydroxy-6-hydroxymethyldihydropteridine diphosphokinase [Clostridiaceae bacterium]|nr:2-amino-4-hydroxy-6-hydroxymethyldihydropteridine diphosphokinase [Clostridiaceae bacterium]